MSSENIAIRVKELSKIYQVYDEPHHRLKQIVLPRFRRMFGLRPKDYFKPICSLENVSFQVERGTTVGIVGKNGSGKSTLLQLICGTLNPSHGEVHINGRISALLELGSGFNPDFTGRENIYLNASLLGLSNKEIDERYEAIVKFADIGDFLDQPVKIYSSGMLMRIAFAVSVHVDPEILVVDEALSVGDELFQRKCFAKISEIKKSGTTILFVSHSGGLVIELCDHAILLNSGRKVLEGTPEKIIALYHKFLYSPTEIEQHLDSEGNLKDSFTKFLSNSDAQSEEAIEEDHIDESFDPGMVPDSTVNYESHGAQISNVRIETLSGRQVNNIVQGRVYRYRYDVLFTEGATGVGFGMMFKNKTGIEIGGASSDEAHPINGESFLSDTTVSVAFEFECNLTNGMYFANCGVLGIFNEGKTYLHRIIDALAFRVHEAPSTYATGLVDFKCQPSWQNL